MMKRERTAEGGCLAQYRRALAALACLVIASTSLQAATLHVGQEKGAQFTTIQAAVDRAVAGDRIIVGPGSYTGRGNCDLDLQGKALAIGSTNPLDPNVVEATVIDCAGTESEPHRGFYIADCNGVEISGLTITHGLASAGGAIFCKKSVLDLAYCRLVDNAATAGGGAGSDPNGGPGGGLYCEDSFVRLTGCLVAGNTAGNGAASKDGQGGAGGDGGGICGVNSEIHVTASTICDNAAGAGGAGGGAGGDGGGICGEAVTLVDSTVWRNAAGDGGPAPQSGRGGQGGGLFAQIATINRCIIEANRAGAGGIVNVAANSDVTTGEPVCGGAGGDGGGLYSDSLEITGSLVVGNRAGRAHAAGPRGLFENGNGGGISCTTGAVRHCTIAGNVVFWRDTTATLDGLWMSARGAGIFSITPVPIENSIIYDNAPVQVISPEGGSVVYSTLMPGMAPKGGSNLFDEPLFVQSGHWVNARDPNSAVEPDDANAVWVSGDYHLTALSPCIDAGDPNYVPEPNEVDLDGRPRLADAAVDMGAYEFQSLVPVYRFWSTRTGKHFYTLDETEKTKLLTEYAYVWSFEGIAYYAYARASEPNLMPVYRFWSGTLGSHFYTIDSAEKDKLIGQFADVWTFEGPVFYAWPEGRQPAGTQAVYRFWSDQLGGHFYTMNEAERDKLIREYSRVWTFEGVAWYAYEEPPAENPRADKPPAEKPPVDEPVTPDPVAFEFTGGRDCASYTFQLKAYRDGHVMEIDSPEVVLVPEAGRMNMVMDLGSMTATLNACHLESTLLEHAATVSDSNSGEEIPFVLHASGTFDAGTTRGPYAIDPQNLSFPAVADNEPSGENETFVVSGAITLDGRKFDIRLTAGATRFDTAGRAVLNVSALPNRLDVEMGGVFQWSRPDKEDLLLDTTVKGHTFQLYVTSARVQTAGLWPGKRAVQTGK